MKILIEADWHAEENRLIVDDLVVCNMQSVCARKEGGPLSVVSILNDATEVYTPDTCLGWAAFILWMGGLKMLPVSARDPRPLRGDVHATMPLAERAMARMKQLSATTAPFILNIGDKPFDTFRVFLPNGAPSSVSIDRVLADRAVRKLGSREELGRLIKRWGLELGSSKGKSRLIRDRIVALLT